MNDPITWRNGHADQRCHCQYRRTATQLSRLFPGFPSYDEIIPHFYEATSLVQTLNDSSRLTPKVVVRATSAASRPRAMRTRPMRGTLFRASNVYHCPPKNTSNQALKSI